MEDKVRKIDGSILDGRTLSEILAAHKKWFETDGKEGKRADLRGANLRGADLRGAFLQDADLQYAHLRGADLRGADLRGAFLRGAFLRGADLPSAPVVPDIHKAVYAAASAEGALDMSTWHSKTCETTHCRAGWVCVLAGEEGMALDKAIGTNAAAALIYMASDPTMERIPNWFASNADALADMKRLAGV